MDRELLMLLAVSGSAAFAAFAGGMLPVVRPTSDRLRGYLLHLAAGILLAVVSVEIWPEIDRLDRAPAMIGGLLAGAAAMVALNAATKRLEARNDGGTPMGLVFAAGIDSVVDGLLIGIGYAAEPELGLLLGIGLGFEKLAMAMTIAAELRDNGCSGGRIAAYNAAIAGLLVPAAATGKILLADPTSRAHTFLLAAAAAALLYIVVVELVARGRETHDSTTAVGVFFLGYIGLAAYAVLAGV